MTSLVAGVFLAVVGLAGHTAQIKLAPEQAEAPLR